MVADATVVEPASIARARGLVASFPEEAVAAAERLKRSCSQPGAGVSFQAALRTFLECRDAHPAELRAAGVWQEWVDRFARRRDLWRPESDPVSLLAKTVGGYLWTLDRAVDQPSAAWERVIAYLWVTVPAIDIDLCPESLAAWEGPFGRSAVRKRSCVAEASLWPLFDEQVGALCDRLGSRGRADALEDLLAVLPRIQALHVLVTKLLADSIPGRELPSDERALVLPRLSSALSTIADHWPGGGLDAVAVSARDAAVRAVGPHVANLATGRDSPPERRRAALEELLSALELYAKPHGGWIPLQYQTKYVLPVPSESPVAASPDAIWKDGRWIRTAVEEYYENKDRSLKTDDLADEADKPGNKSACRFRAGSTHYREYDVRWVMSTARFSWAASALRRAIDSDWCPPSNRKRRARPASSASAVPLDGPPTPSVP